MSWASLVSLSFLVLVSWCPMEEAVDISTNPNPEPVPLFGQPDEEDWEWGSALQAVTRFSGVEEDALSYNQQAQEDVQGIKADHRSMTQTIDTMQNVFLTQEEKRKEGKEHYIFSSIKEHIANTRDSISGREHMTGLLEEQLSSLENSLHIMQHRLDKLMAQ